MGFLNSAWLWGALGAAGVAVPILIHLLYRKHKRQTPWAAMELLRKALVIRSGQIKLEDFIILCLRCLVLALVALALARPTLRRDTALFSAGQRRIGLVLALDSSYSMAHGQFRKRYDRALERAATILSTLREGDPVTVVLMGAHPRILIRSTGYNAARFARLLATEAHVLPEPLNLEQNLDELERLTGELKTPSRECYLITDGQGSDWNSLSDEASATLRRLGKAAKAYLVPVANDGEDNLAITSLSFASGSLRRNGTARFSAEVSNYGRHSRDAGALIFSVNGEAVSKKAVGVVEPGRALTVAFYSSFATDGDVRIAAALSTDDLALDNHRQTVVSVRSAIRVLSIDGAPAAQPAALGATFYLDRALRGKARGDEAPLQVTRAEWQDLDSEALSDYDVIALANVADLSEAAVKKLDQFVRRGGGLMVFAGDKVNAELYNGRLRTATGSLLPAVLEKDIQAPDPAKGWALGKVRAGHPISDLIGRLPAELLDSARFQRVCKATPGEGGVTLVSLAENDLPLLLEKQVGRGSVLLFTCAADAKWGNFPLHPVYTILLHQAVTYMTSHPERRNALVGQAVTVPVNNRRLGEVVKLTGPGGQTRELKVVAVGGQPSCICEPETNGFYKIEMGGNATALVAVNLDARESDVKVLPEPVLARKAAAVSLAMIGPEENLAELVKTGRNGFELARILLLAALGTLLLQSWLARRFTQRISEGITDVAAEVTRGRAAGARRAQVE